MIATMNWALFYFAEAMALLAGGCLGFAFGKQRGQNDVIDRVAEAWIARPPIAGSRITEGGGIFYATGPDGRVHRSLDGGKTWEWMGSEGPKPFVRQVWENK